MSLNDDRYTNPENYPWGGVGSLLRLADRWDATAELEGDSEVALAWTLAARQLRAELRAIDDGREEPGCPYCDG